MALKNNLISHWKLEEANSTRVDSHSSNDLTDNNNVGQGTGKLGNCASFDESNNEYLSITDGSQLGLDITGDLSISAWIKPGSVPGIFGGHDSFAIVTKRDYAGNNRSYGLHYGNKAGLGLIFEAYDDGTGDSGIAVSVDVDLGTGTWKHVAVVYTTAGEATFYVNGAKQGDTQTGLPNSIHNGSAPFLIAGGDSSSNDEFDGDIDEVSIWNREIESSEITAIYNSGSGLSYDTWEEDNTHSIDLNGSNQYLSKADEAVLDETGAITMEAWVKVENAPGNNVRYPIVGKGNSDGTNLSYLFTYKNDAGNLRLLFENTQTGCSAGTSYTWSDDNDLGTGDWKHVAVTYDGSGTVEFFVDGSSVGSSGGGNSSVCSGGASFTVGAEHGGANFFDGLIDDVRLWGDVRTEAEINDNKCVQLDGDEADLVGCWQMNDGFIDTGPNNLTLTNNGSASFSEDNSSSATICAITFRPHLISY